MDRLFAPTWMGGWTLTRILLGVVLLIDIGRRWPDLADGYAAQDYIFALPPLYLANHVVFSLPWIQALWALNILALVGWLVGGRWFKPSALLWFVANFTLLSAEAINTKAHDRLAWWITLVLLFSPAGETRSFGKWRSPAARWGLMILFCALYGSTGWLKALQEPRWWTTGVLQYDLVHPDFAGGPLARWVSGQAWITLPAGWLTVIFECSFPLLVWFRRTNPWVLLLGASFHVGIAVLMNVGKFSYVALAAYPVLLHPEVLRRLLRLPQVPDDA